MSYHHQSTNSDFFPPRNVQQLKRQLAIRVISVWLGAFLLMILSTILFETWYLVLGGMVIAAILAGWMTVRILGKHLSEPGEVSRANVERIEPGQTDQVTESAENGHRKPTGNHNQPATDTEDTATADRIELTQAELEEIRQTFNETSGVNFEGIAVHHKVNLLASELALAALFGYTLAELDNSTLLDLVSEEFRSTVLKNTVINYEIPYTVIGVRKDGTTIPVEICGQTLIYQKQTVRVIGVRALAEQGQAEVLRALQQAKEALETKVKEGTAELRNANERLRLELDERKQTEEEFLRRNHELTVLQSAAVAITSSLDLRYVIDTVVQEMVKLLDVESCTISEYNDIDNTVTQIAEYHITNGWWDSTSPSSSYRLADYPLKESVLEEQTIEQMTISQPYADPSELAYMQQAELKTRLMLPMAFQRHVDGLMELEDSRVERSFTHQEISLARLLANQAASAIENARLYQKARQEIIERKQAEANLEEERALLAQRVKERTAELSKANAELARAARLKDEFLAAMSHELRTPLNAILGSAEILKDEIFGSLNDKQLKYSRNIDESGHHLLELINDILDLSKIEAGKMELDLGPVSVKSTCEASLRLVKQLAHKKQLQLSLKIEDSVTTLIADERRLKQILVNLLSNAIKFTPEGGQVGLEVRGHDEQQLVQFIVWDTGIGIPQEDMARLFQPFVQLDSKLSRQYTGTGLGLSLVSRMTEMHGGGVSVESEVGQGSRFTISFPWSESAETGPPAIEARPMAPDRPAALDHKLGIEQPLILLADDNEDNINLILDYLQAHRYHIVVARNGQEAIDRAQEERPDLILMDIQMPGMDGLEATRHLRADSSLTTVPIIAVTALAMPGDRERCLAAGANEYLSKPVNLRRLVQIIETQLNWHQTQREYS